VSWWTVGYAALLCVGTYAAGLPDLTRSPRSAFAACIGATATGAVGISAGQLVTGSQARRAPWTSGGDADAVLAAFAHTVNR